MNAQDQAVLAAAEAVLGKETVLMFARLHQAAGVSRQPVELFTRAIKSVYKSENERLAGKVLQYLESGVETEDRAKRIKFACGIGTRRSGESLFDSIIAEASTKQAQPTKQ